MKLSWRFVSLPMRGDLPLAVAFFFHEDTSRMPPVALWRWFSGTLPAILQIQPSFEHGEYGEFEWAIICRYFPKGFVNYYHFQTNKTNSMNSFSSSCIHWDLRYFHRISKNSSANWQQNTKQLISFFSGYSKSLGRFSFQIAALSFGPIRLFRELSGTFPTKFEM